MNFFKKPAAGYLMVEMLTALTLFSLAGSTLYTGYREGVHAYRRIESSRQIFSAPKLFFIRLEQDLRNMAVLQSEPFEGTEKEISFPVFLTETSEKGESISRLARVRYYLQDSRLVREEEELSNRLKKEPLSERVMLNGVENMSFSFPYINEDEERVFEKFWRTEPYPGIPRAVRLEITAGEQTWIKMVSIPHGTFAFEDSTGGLA